MGWATAAVALAVVAALGGCSSGGSKDGASPAPNTSTGQGSGPATSTPSGTATDAPGTPSPGQSAGQSPDPGTGTTAPAPRPAPSTSAPAPAPSVSPPGAGETLVAVTRSGGIAGKNSTLIIKGDGSFLRLNAKAETVDRDKLSASALAKLRTALQKADFPRLPRISMPEQPVFDSFTYAFRHGGYEVAADQSTLPRPLQGVLSALPPFEPR
ncbi:hypothetical protein OHA37_12270 [Streptomyces sp. NBC_00335]|uniref:hypothetical protein n=1 Tax=unclassified Streptomyces TaxID=2593676 RepID=UPI0022557FDE|nr:MULTISPECIES: hypothetical protein [unclassified Streptomyces]MCX5404656.1 hypothetical protein [Streptomyces sp. NBC_00086]